jgi:uridine kinase
MPRRQEVLDTVARAVTRPIASDVTRVAIDGVDGAGKTHFADELAEVLGASGRSVIRASVDGFHNPRSIRYRQGRDSPEGFFEDSYDYEQLKAVLLDPLSPGGSGHYRAAVFDHRSDRAVSPPSRVASPGDILVFDGIFLHRPELRAYWDYSVFLEVAFAVSIPRGAQRGESSPDPEAANNRRYVRGQELYLRTCEPARFATVTVNNDDLLAPYIVMPSAPAATSAPAPGRRGGSTS